ncbi:lantibiotic dehydratase C-terminal domain-containing protein [Nonomuraea sp. NPDC026600]|uniref:lantibiotic dehydratase C-terminal domain-containing protein n=1 Tax=Nonomuraea sp. NPDC026600 TaxID=3155363 RepID=UPI0033DF5B4D
MSWISAHLFHAGPPDTLVERVVAPLVAELDGELDGFFFLHYWEGGPHLRLRVKPVDGACAGRIRDLIEGRAVAYFAGHPSVRGFRTGQYQELAARYARAEDLTGYDERLHPNDAVEFIAYVPEHRAYGEDACIAAVEEHFTDSSRLALGLLATRPDRGRRAAAGLAALTLTVAACLPDERVLASRLRAGIRFPPDVEQAFQRDRDRLLRQARRLWGMSREAEPAGGMPDAGEPTGGMPAAWAASLRTLRDRLTELHAVPSDVATPAGSLARLLRPEAAAVPYILLRCSHLLNNRLGIIPAAEERLILLTLRVMAALDES